MEVAAAHEARHFSAPSIWQTGPCSPDCDSTVDPPCATVDPDWHSCRGNQSLRTPEGCRPYITSPPLRSSRSPVRECPPRECWCAGTFGVEPSAQRTRGPFSETPTHSVPLEPPLSGIVSRPIESGALQARQQPELRPSLYCCRLCDQEFLYQHLPIRRSSHDEDNRQERAEIFGLVSTERRDEAQGALKRTPGHDFLPLRSVVRHLQNNSRYEAPPYEASSNYCVEYSGPLHPLRDAVVSTPTFGTHPTDDSVYDRWRHRQSWNRPGGGEYYPDDMVAYTPKDIHSSHDLRPPPPLPPLYLPLAQQSPSTDEMHSNPHHRADPAIWPNSTKAKNEPAVQTAISAVAGSQATTPGYPMSQSIPRPRYPTSSGAIFSPPAFTVGRHEPLDYFHPRYSCAPRSWDYRSWGRQPPQNLQYLPPNDPFFDESGQPWHSSSANHFEKDYPLCRPSRVMPYAPHGYYDYCNCPYYDQYCHLLPSQSEALHPSARTRGGFAEVVQPVGQASNQVSHSSQAQSPKRLRDESTAEEHRSRPFRRLPDATPHHQSAAAATTSAGKVVDAETSPPPRFYPPAHEMEKQEFRPPQGAIIVNLCEDSKDGGFRSPKCAGGPSQYPTPSRTPTSAKAGTYSPSEPGQTHGSPRGHLCGVYNGDAGRQPGQWHVPLQSIEPASHSGSKISGRRNHYSGQDLPPDVQHTQLLEAASILAGWRLTSHRFTPPPSAYRLAEEDIGWEGGVVDERYEC